MVAVDLLVDLGRSIIIIGLVYVDLDLAYRPFSSNSESVVIQ